MVIPDEPLRGQSVLSGDFHFFECGPLKGVLLFYYLRTLTSDQIKTLSETSTTAVLKRDPSLSTTERRMNIAREI